MEKERKEIGKLLELLNEYEKEKNPKTEYKWFSSYYKPLCYGFKVLFQGWHDNGEDYSEEIATSKQYGFIERLVKNDKIDISKIKCGYVYNDTEEDKVKNVIMNLSISDTPIKDLLLYLK